MIFVNMFRTLVAVPFFLVTVVLIPALVVLHVAYYQLHKPDMMLDALNAAQVYARAPKIFGFEIQRALEEKNLQTLPQESLERGMEELFPSVWMQETVEGAVRLFYTWFFSDAPIEDFDAIIDLQLQHEKFSAVVTPQVQMAIKDFPACPSMEAELSFTCNPGSERLSLAMNEIESFVHLVVPQKLSLRDTVLSQLPVEITQQMNERVSYARGVDHIIQKGLTLFWVVVGAISAFILVLGATSLRSAVIWLGSLLLASSLPLLIVSFFISGEMLVRQAAFLTGNLSLEAQSLINDVIQIIFQDFLRGIIFVMAAIAIAGLVFFMGGIAFRARP